ncbi:agmatine coumaroyltransferase-2-like [Oryza brachyantha]|uniref:agmatine coumaroyltransferase-2-like n=1 Tax=Oryza brachyantha TaxID=4533 RepID=UPI001ADCECD3|nr:agmatine coumaroyltransferase-2-like [Oryza brachyantha]
MNVRIDSSKVVKPLYDGAAAPGTLAGGESVPLSVFDTVTYDVYMAVIYAFRPPNPPNAALEVGLAKALAVYREWAGELADGDGTEGRRPAVLLNDRGALLVEATVSAPLAAVMPFKPSPELLRLHPSTACGRAGELVRVQLTRFACGSLVIGFTSHHRVADGQAAGNFLVAWGLASRRLPVAPLPVCDRATRFPPRNPPLVQFPHRETEYYAPKEKHNADAGDDDDELATPVAHDKIKVHKVHFTKEFLAGIKARASSSSPSRHGYSTFESVVGHLWRAVTAARGLGAGEPTTLRISVNGRTRMRPPVPRDYFGNLVLWAFPRSTAGELVSGPVQHAAELIHRAVARVDDAYFRSFVDFASSGAVEAERLAATADESQAVLCPDVEVDSWLGIDFYDLDFGGGGPAYFMPSYLPMEGTVFLVPSFLGDGGIDAYVSLFETHLDEFKKICYTY